MSEFWRNGTTVLTYHQVGEFPDPWARPGIYCHARAFHWQMRLLAALQIPVLTLEQVIQSIVEGASIPRRSILITFDDGDKGFTRYAAPVLAQQGFPSVVFAISRLLGKEAQWLGELGLPQAPLADRGEVQEWTRSGVTIGAHSRSHPRLSKLTDDQLREEILGSRQDLESILGLPVKAFCYPFGDLDERVVQVVKEAGYQVAFSTRDGRLHPDRSDRFLLPRIGINYGNSLLVFLWKLFFISRPHFGKSGGNG